MLLFPRIETPIKNRDAAVFPLRWSRSFKESLFKFTSDDDVKSRTADAAKKLGDDAGKVAERGKQKPTALK